MQTGAQEAPAASAWTLGWGQSRPCLDPPAFPPRRERSGFFSPEHCEPESPWASSSAATTPSTPTTPTTEGEGDGLSYNQRSLQRWEKDEELGELSTISPVLYANMNFPSLKQDYPGGPQAQLCPVGAWAWHRVTGDGESLTPNSLGSVASSLAEELLIHVPVRRPAGK